MKNLVILLLLFTAFALNAQQVYTFHTIRKTSIIEDFNRIDGKDYLLINNNADSVFLGNDYLFSNENSSSLIVNENGQWKYLLSYKMAQNVTVLSRVLAIDNKPYLLICANKDVVMNGSTYRVESEFVNCFLFEIGSSIKLVDKLYHPKYDVWPDVYTNGGKNQFFFFTNSPVIYSFNGDSIVAASNTKHYEGYFLICGYNGSAWSVDDDLAFNFFGNVEIKAHNPVFIIQNEGIGVLLNTLCYGLSIFRNDKLIAKTDSFESKKSIYYPLNFYRDKGVVPLVIAHDRGYSANLNAFYQFNNKWTFFINPFLAKEICFNGDCITNTKKVQNFALKLYDYNWETGTGKLGLYPENHSYTVQSAKAINGQTYLLANYQSTPGYWSDGKVQFSKQSISNYFVAKTNGAEVAIPFLIQGLNRPTSFVQINNELSAKILDNELAIAGSFAQGIKLALGKM